MENSNLGVDAGTLQLIIIYNAMFGQIKEDVKYQLLLFSYKTVKC